MPDRPKRDCRCPRVRHQHGTRRAYEADRCRCLRCRAAHANSVRAYRTGGQWREAYIDAADTKQQLRALAAAGITTRRVAAHSGLSMDMVAYLRGGRQKQVTPKLAAIVDTTYRALWHKGRADADARRCMTQVRAIGYRTAPDDTDKPGRRPHGTHAAFNLHKLRKETPCRRCVDAERTFQQERYQRDRARYRAALEILAESA